MKNVIINAKNLCKSYTNGQNFNHVLKNINLEIYEGDFTVIMGNSGSGKSTLLYSISSMDRPSSGSIEILGKNILALDEKKISKMRDRDISFIFQNINLLPDMTAFENITFPAYMSEKKEYVNKRAKDLLLKFGLWEERKKYPNEMSGGQQQRIAILRAVVNSPKIIFGDEPTGALNSASGLQVLDLLTELNQNGQSMVMVTHDIKSCARGNRLLYLTDGRVVGDLFLGKYEPAEQQKREDIILKFLKEHNW